MTFNMLSDRDGAGDDWGPCSAAGKLRRDKAIALLLAQSPDIIALQELAERSCDVNCTEAGGSVGKAVSIAIDVDRVLLGSGGYGVIRSRSYEEDGNASGTCARAKDDFWTRIYFKKARFEVLKQGGFDWGFDAKFGVDAILRDKAPGAEGASIYVRASHWDYARPATQLIEAQQTIQALASARVKGSFRHAIVLGDFNHDPCRDPYNELVGHPTYELVDSAVVEGSSEDECTVTRKSATIVEEEPPTSPFNRLDYIFHGTCFRHANYRVLKGAEHGYGSLPFPSDHFPVYVELSYAPCEPYAVQHPDLEIVNALMGVF